MNIGARLAGIALPQVSVAVRHRQCLAAELLDFLRKESREGRGEAEFVELCSVLLVVLHCPVQVVQDVGAAGEELEAARRERGEVGQQTFPSPFTCGGEGDNETKREI